MGMAGGEGKGVTSVTISGPGLDKPIEMADGVKGNQISDLARFLEATGFSELVFGSDGVGLPTEIKHAPVGPSYLVTVDGIAEIPMEVYPYAEHGPLVYVEPGLYPADYGEGFGARGGWFSADPELFEIMVGFGVPLDTKIKVPAAVSSKLESKEAAEIVSIPAKSPFDPGLKTPAKLGSETPANLIAITETEVPGSGLPLGRVLVGIGLVSVVAAIAWVGVRRPHRAAAAG